MKVLVAVKVVPEPSSVRFAAGLNRIVREGVANLVNPLDRMALDVALAGRDRIGGQVVALTMGPPEIEPVLRQVADLGVDRVIHLCDPCFAGADTLATSRALAQVVRIEQADLLMCGRSAMDGGTAQTPAQIAEIAGLPFAAGVVDLDVGDGTVTVVDESDEGIRRRCLPLPAVISLEGGVLSGAAGRARGPGVMEVWDADRLGGDPGGYGIRGSRTYVQGVIDTATVRAGRSVSLDEAIGLVSDRIETAAEPAPTTDRPVVGADGPALWVMAEAPGRDLHPTSLEGLACARSIAGRLGAGVVAVVLGDDAGSHPDLLLAGGADRVIVGRAPGLAGQPPGVMAAALAPLVEHRRPLGVIAPWSVRGRDYLARVAARLELGLTGDFVGLDTAPHPAGGDRTDLVWLKPAWGGTAMARVVARTVPALGTLRPGVWRPLSAQAVRGDGIEEVVLDVEAVSAAAQLVGRELEPEPSSATASDGQTGAMIDSGRVIMCVGGEVGADLAGRLRRQAERLGWGFGGNAAAVARGLLPPRAEISLARRSISPLVFIGVDLDRPEDLDPVRGAGLLLAVGSKTPAAVACRSDLVVSASAAELAVALEDQRVWATPAYT